jgi:SAM-dependent methyltransferase
MQAALLMASRVEGEVLDLGCGPGTLALVAARQGAHRAVGTDINARAVAFARLNARLNGVAAEFHAGDLYEPVRGRRFDLVVAQPPYVIQPEHTGAVTYLHGGPRGEDLVLRALAGLPALLAPGGRGILLVDVPLPAAEPLATHYRRALADPALDLVLALGPAAPPEVQAFAYAQLEDGALGPRYAGTAGRYLEHLSNLETPGFRHAAVVVRRPHAERPAAALTATFPVSGFGGADSRSADDLLASIDLAAASPEVLRRARVMLSPRARWTIESDGPVPDDGIQWQVRFAPGALAVDQEVSEASAVLVHCMSTAEDVGAGLAAYAEACGAMAEEVAPQAIEFVRHALRSGLLEPRPTEP